MTAPIISVETARVLEERHVAFLEARLSGEQARAEWQKVLEDAYADLSSRRVRDLVDLEALLPALRRALSSPLVFDVVFPVSTDVGRRAFEIVSRHEGKLGLFLNPEARDAIDSLLERSDLVPQAVVRRVFEEEAVEEIIAAVLYDGLKEFNDTVNPFFADWGLPGLVKRVVPIGGGAVMKAVETLKGEFDKRLEPEIRKFIAAFTRRAKGKIADLVIAKAGDPHFVALRKNIARFLYEERMAALLAGADEGARKLGERATVAFAGEVIRRDEAWTEVEKGLRAFVEEHGDAPLAAWLASLGAVAAPDLGPVADLTWPYARELVTGPVFRELLVRLTREFYESVSFAGLVPSL